MLLCPFLVFTLSLFDHFIFILSSISLWCNRKKRFPAVSSPLGMFLSNKKTVFLNYKKTDYSVLPLLFVRSSRSRTSAGTSQYPSAVTGGSHRSLTGNHLSDFTVFFRRFGALLRSHVHLLSIHPSQHGQFTASQDFSVKYPTDYSLRHRFFNISRFLVCKKGSTRIVESQVRTDICKAIFPCRPASNTSH